MRIEDVRIVCAFARQPEEKSLFSTLYSIIPIRIMFRLLTCIIVHSVALTDLAKAPFAPAPPPRALRGMSDYEVSSHGSDLFRRIITFPLLFPLSA